VFWTALAPHLPQTGSILDYGCGTGRFTERVLRFSLGTSYTGLDINRLAIAALKSRFDQVPRARFECASPLPTPLRKSSQGLVFSLTVLQHVPDAIIEGVLAEIRRVLRPGRRVALIEDNNPEGFKAAAHMSFRPPSYYLEKLEGEQEHLEIISAERPQSHYLLVMSCA
jgi:SAM-dependent methyltransferase